MVAAGACRHGLSLPVPLQLHLMLLLLIALTRAPLKASLFWEDILPVAFSYTCITAFHNWVLV
jgi:hypothetical protein